MNALRNVVAWTGNHIGLVILVFAASCGDGAGQAGSDTVTLLDYETVAPAGWQAHPPQSSMRVAEFRIPPAQEGADGIEVVVFYFGAGEGGSVEANVERWTAQFTNGENVTPSPVVEPLDAEFPTTLVQLEGMYRRGIGMTSDAEAKPDQMLLAAIVETPEGNLHIQMYGPSAAVREQRDALIEFVTGISP